MASSVNVCRFLPTAGGTTDWTVSAAVVGYQTPAQAGAVNAQVYKYRAESGDLRQWEIGYGTYTVAGTVLARTTVLSNSAGTTAKINFTGVPQVAIVALSGDLNPIDGALFGLTLSTAGASTTFTVAAGWAADSTAVDILRLYSSLAKTTGTFVVGAGNGALDTGSIGAASYYHVFLIKRLDTGVVDVLISLSATAPTMPSNYTLFRRIGSMKTVSSQWKAFTQVGDEFLWTTPILSANSVSCSTTAANQTLEVPTNLSLIAIVRGQVNVAAATDVALLIYAPDTGTQATSSPGANVTTYANGTTTAATFDKIVRTNTSGQVGVVASTNSGTYFIVTVGWIDTRGRVS